jgi:hypothetical protein
MMAPMPVMWPVALWNGTMENSTEMRVPSLRNAGTPSRSPAPQLAWPVRMVSV